eukprot:4096743-Amphidinium_carterae.1
MMKRSVCADVSCLACQFCGPDHESPHTGTRTVGSHTLASTGPTNCERTFCSTPSPQNVVDHSTARRA